MRAVPGFLALSAALVLSGCSFFFTSGPPSTMPRPGIDPDCSQSAAWPWVDVVFVGTYTGVFTAVSVGTADIDLPTAIGMAAGVALHTAGALVGFGKVSRCQEWVRAASVGTNAGMPPAGFAPAPGPAAPPSCGPAPPGAGPPPAVSGGGRPTLGCRLVNFPLDRVLAIRIGIEHANDIVAWLGPPVSTAALPDGKQIWTWSRGPEALSIAFDANGRAVEVAAAGGPPW